MAQAILERKSCAFSGITIGDYKPSMVCTPVFLVLRKITVSRPAWATSENLSQIKHKIPDRKNLRGKHGKGLVTFL